MEDILSQRNQAAFAPPASTAPAKLGGQERLSQIPHSTPRPTGRVRKKSKQQLMLESQERRVVSKKEEARAKRKATATRKRGEASDEKDGERIAIGVTSLRGCHRHRYD
jgi:hypothetical protein